MKMTKFFIAALLVTMTSGVQASGLTDWIFTFDRYKGVDPVKDEVYSEECGACHYAYYPGLLPRRSWKKLVAPDALTDHFGDDAELDEQTRQHIANFLSANAADDSYYKRSRKIMQSIDADKTPIRISEVPFIKRRHEEVPKEWVKDNPKVKSFSFCDKCHRRIKEGVFEEDSVLIPGHGYWTW